MNFGSPQSGLAPAILSLVRNVLLPDPAYIDRIKRHYKMFRDKIDGEALSAKRDRNKRRKTRP